MKNRGFTLAEVLIVITVIGIIALMLLPTIMSNVQKNQVGPALLRAVSTLETANALMINEQDMYNFTESCIEANSDAGYETNCFTPFLANKLGAAKDTATYSYTKIENPATTVSVSGFNVLKQGISYAFSRPASGAYTIVTVDLNGPLKKPNIQGKDLFFMNMSDEDGKVYLRGANSDNFFTDHWGTKCNATTIADSQYCAGSVIDNGGKVIYPWK